MSILRGGGGGGGGGLKSLATIALACFQQIDMVKIMLWASSISV